MRSLAIGLAVSMTSTESSTELRMAHCLSLSCDTTINGTQRTAFLLRGARGEAAAFLRAVGSKCLSDCNPFIGAGVNVV